MTGLRLLAAAAAVALATPCRAEETWERLVVGRVGGNLPPAVAAIWSNAAAPASGEGEPVDVAYAVFTVGENAVVVSIVSDRQACRSPDVGSDDIHAVCAGRVDILGAERRPVAIPGACFVRSDPLWAPDVDRSRSGAWASLDRDTGVVRVVALRDGQPVPGCDKTVSLR